MIGRECFGCGESCACGEWLELVSVHVVPVDGRGGGEIVSQRVRFCSEKCLLAVLKQREADKKAASNG